MHLAFSTSPSVLLGPRTFLSGAGAVSSIRPRSSLFPAPRAPPTRRGLPPSMPTMTIADMALGAPVPETDVGYELRGTAEKGEGVYATRRFAPGETVLVGFIVSEVSANHSHATQVSRDKWVQHGGLNSKVNHSCDPNCGVHLNESGAYDFVARKHVKIGEELTFDYAMRNYVIEHFPERCACGAAECRVTITGYKDLPDEFKRRYEGLIAPYLLEIDREDAEKAKQTE